MLMEQRALFRYFRAFHNCKFVDDCMELELQQFQVGL